MIKKGNVKKLGPTIIGPYCVFDVFYGVAELLNGKEAYVPGAVKGFLKKPYAISGNGVVSKADIMKAAAVKTGEFIPAKLLSATLKSGRRIFSLPWQRHFWIAQIPSHSFPANRKSTSMNLKN